MAIRINTNVSSLVAQRHLAGSVQDVEATNRRLASGDRITRAADDAAGLSISENLRADIRSINAARRNTLDAISMVQTAEGGTTEISTMLIRLRELAVQAASDTNGAQERINLDKEVIAIKEEIDRIAVSTVFNGKRLLAAEAELPDELRSETYDFPLEVQVGKDYYAESDGAALVNPVNVTRIDFSEMNLTTEGFNSLHIGRGDQGVRAFEKGRAQNALLAIDDALMRIADYRSYMGAIQNRLQSTMEGLAVSIENLSTARSRIMDADFAVETAGRVRGTILSQAGTAVLAAANAEGATALELLRASN